MDFMANSRVTRQTDGAAQADKKEARDMGTY